MSETTATPAAPKPEKVTVASTLKLSTATEARRKKAIGDDKKPVKGADGKIVYNEYTTTFVVPTAPGANDNALASPAGFGAFVAHFFNEGAKVPDLFRNFLEKQGIVELFEDATEAALVKQPDGRQTVDEARFIDALYNGAPRSVNTISSVTAELNKTKVLFAEMSLAATEAGQDKDKLLAVVREVFGLESIAAFGTRMTDLHKQIKAGSAQLKALQAAKAERDQKKTREAVAAPAAPVK